MHGRRVNNGCRIASVAVKLDANFATIEFCSPNRFMSDDKIIGFNIIYPRGIFSTLFACADRVSRTLPSGRRKFDVFAREGNVTLVREYTCDSKVMRAVGVGSRNETERGIGRMPLE